jgi:hypothetical protein
VKTNYFSLPLFGGDSLPLLPKSTKLCVVLLPDCYTYRYMFKGAIALKVVFLHFVYIPHLVQGLNSMAEQI